MESGKWKTTLISYIWFKDCDVLSRIFFIQVTAPFSPTVESAAQIGDALVSFRFQVIRNHHRKPAAWTIHQNIIVAWNLLQVVFDSERIDLMGIRQTLELFTVIARTHIENESFFVEQNIFIELGRREHVDK